MPDPDASSGALTSARSMHVRSTDATIVLVHGAWAIVGTADRVLPPSQQEIMARRAGSHTIELDAPHLSMLSDPGPVARLIASAAAGSA